MNFDYFYSEQSEQFAFYRIPKLLYTDERFKGLSSDAKTLYGLLLDRVSLSVKNRWIDERGRIFVYCTLEAVEKALGCAEQKAAKLLSELETIGLIEKKRQGLGKPNRIYVKNFIEPQISLVQNNENHGSRTVRISAQELRESSCNNTQKNNTDFSNTNPFLSDEMEEREKYRQYFEDQLQVKYLLDSYPYDWYSGNLFVWNSMACVSGICEFHSCFGSRSHSFYPRRFGKDCYCSDYWTNHSKENF